MKKHGWIIQNGSGWNHHRTVDTLNTILVDGPERLPAVPDGYGVLVAPISDKPLGLRCAFVKLLPRITDEDGYDDGYDENAGEADAWAADHFHLDVERLYSCLEDEQSEDSTAYFIRKMQEQIAKIQATAP